MRNLPILGLQRPPPRRFLSTAGRALLVLAAGAGSVCACELMARGSLGRGWSLGPILPGSLVLAGGGAVALVLFLYALTRRLGVAVVAVVALIATLTFAHIRKMALLGVPLMPWDLAEWRQIAALLPTLATGSLLTMLALLLAAVGAGAWLAWRSPGAPLRWAPRLILATVCVLYLAGLIGTSSPRVSKRLWSYGLINKMWDPRENLDRNGFLLPLLLSAHSLTVREPGYSREAVEKALAGVSAVPPRPVAPEPVDVVVYMGEAFWDPTKLGVRFSRDPMPNARRLLAGTSSGELVSPVYGGETANAEFEFLTGIPCAFLPPGTFPYEHYLKRPIEALPSIFQRQGYRTLGVHNFHRWYWMRDVVYPLMGFERFVALEQLGEVPNDPVYPSDEPLVDRLLKELDAAQQPVFAFAISMVAHSPYTYASKADQEVRVLDPMPAAEKHILENYASALFRADRALGRLVQALEARPRKTLLVFFGDHLPALGDRYSVYVERRFVPSPEAAPDDERMFRVPVAFWSNAPMELGGPIDLPMSALGARVLRVAGLPSPKFYSFVESLQQSGAEAFPSHRSAATGVSLDIERYRLLSYDRLLGEGYSMAAPLRSPAN